MSFPAYPEYKDSGIQWLGEIPNHWTARSLGSLGQFEGGSGFPHAYQGESDGEIPFHKVNALTRTHSNGTLSSKDNTVSRVTARELRAKIISAGALVFAKVGAALLLARIGRLPSPACIDNNMMAFLPSNLLAREFSRYLLLQIPFDLLVNPGAVPSVNEGQMKRHRVPLPPKVEQSTIADFLDRETAKIDALIGKQEQLIATLREDRIATVTHAVTKGLDPNAEMKDSGVEWLGKIPAHWEHVPFKRLATRITDGAHISPETEGGIFDFVSTKDVSERGIDFDGALKTSPESYEYLVRNGCKPNVGDVLFSKDGTIGRTVVVDVDRNFVVASSLIIIKPEPTQVTPSFTHFSCQSSPFYQQVDAYVKGAGLPRLSISNLRRVIALRPPVAEQHRIAAHLDARCAKFDALIAKSEQMIGVLREYRSALITDAVTGKIDVRGAA